MKKILMVAFLSVGTLFAQDQCCQNQQDSCCCQYSNPAIHDSSIYDTSFNHYNRLQRNANCHCNPCHCNPCNCGANQSQPAASSCAGGQCAAKAASNSTCPGGQCAAKIASAPASPCANGQCPAPR